MNPSNEIPRDTNGKPINWNQKGNGPYPYFNPLTSRQKMANALRTVYNNS